MIRVAAVLAVLVVILFALWWGLRWLVKNRVRVTIYRPPTGRELLLLSMLFQIFKTLLRLLLRR